MDVDAPESTNQMPKPFSYNDLAYPTEETHMEFLSPDQGKNAPSSFLTAQAIFQLLFDRGFDHWWGEIDADTQLEIVDKIEDIVVKFA